jgi:hypothetical protein
MLGRGLRTRVRSLPGAGSQLGDARDGGVIVEAVIDQKTADHGRRATLVAPAVDVNDSAGGDFVSDAREDPVVAISVNDAVVRNGMSEVMDFPSGALRRELQCLPIRVEVISTHHACRVSSCRHSAFSLLELFSDGSTSWQSLAGDSAATAI